MTYKTYENKKTGYHKQPISKELRWQIWERDNFTCQVCGSRKFLTIDHIEPESLGGDLSEDNLQTLCWPCNRRKNARPPGSSIVDLTWRELLWLRPELEGLMAEIQQVKDDPTQPYFCANAAWYGYYEFRGRGFKRRMIDVLDIRETDGVEARAAYDLAYKTLYAALPDCRGCACG